MRLLEHRHATLSQFFSPVVLDTLAVEDPEIVLAPRETEVSVLFCDLRGFSRESERHAGDLLGLLQRVSQALGRDDPCTFASKAAWSAIFRATPRWAFGAGRCRNTTPCCGPAGRRLAIRTEFEATAGFHAGIGIATGRAVAGKIGTVDQVKVTVFGPVVNLASRLESMTKTAPRPDSARRIDRPGRAAARAARGRPRAAFGHRQALRTRHAAGSERVVAAGRREYPALTDEHIGVYETALEKFLARQWAAAFELLHHIPGRRRSEGLLTVLSPSTTAAPRRIGTA